MVVVGGPALPEHRVGTRTVAPVEERLPIDFRASDRDAEILLPLRGQVVADGLVEGVRVVRVGEALDLRSIWVPRLVLGLRRGGVESDVVVGAVSQVADEPLADRAT